MAVVAGGTAQSQNATGKGTTFSREILEQAGEMHRHFLSIDTHTDTPTLMKRRKGFDIGNETAGQVDLPKMEKGMLDGVFMAAFVHQGPRNRASSDSAVRVVDHYIDLVCRQVEINKGRCGIARTADDMERLKKEEKKAIFLGIENGYGIGKDIANLKRFKKKGISYITLCHTYNNDLCDTSNRVAKEWGGLSPFGKEVVKEMNRLGLIIDVSHAGENTFQDVVRLSEKPIIASHSGCKAIYNHNRNLSDGQLRALAENGGVIHIYLVDVFLNPNRKEATLDDMLNHLDHAVRVAGINHVGIGTDFDGGGGVAGCLHAGQLLHITAGLIERGYTEEEIAKIWGGNFLRVMREVQR